MCDIRIPIACGTRGRPYLEFNALILRAVNYVVGLCKPQTTMRYVPRPAIMK